MRKHKIHFTSICIHIALGMLHTWNESTWHNLKLFTRRSIRRYSQLVVPLQVHGTQEALSEACYSLKLHYLVNWRVQA